MVLVKGKRCFWYFVESDKFPLLKPACQSHIGQKPCTLLEVWYIRAVAIRFGVVMQVRCVCATTRYARGCRGMLPPEKFGNLGAMRLLLRQFLGQYNASRRPDDSKFQHGSCVLGGIVWVSAKQWHALTGMPGKSR